MQCSFCGSDDYVSNGVDGYICMECGTQFFSDCVNCVPDMIENYDIIDGQYVVIQDLVCIFCGKVLMRKVVPYVEDEDEE
jgi:hypothetical protein